MRENFAKLLEETFKRFSGDLVEGVVVKVTDKEAFVDFGWKSEGVISLKELGFKPDIGSRIEACIVEQETEEGYAVLSVNCARTLKEWLKIAHDVEKTGLVEGVIRQRVRGGYKVDIGGRVFAFLPMSQVDVMPVVRPDEWLDRRIKAKVLSIDRKRRSIVISRRKLVEEERLRKRKHTLGRLRIGQIVDAVVKNVVDFGIFVDVDGVDGLVHRSDVSWSGLRDPKDVAEIGDRIKLKVTRIDRDKERLFLSLKELFEDPWIEHKEHFKEGLELEGKVAKVAGKGIFVELPNDIAGFLPFSNLPDGVKLRLRHKYRFVVDRVDNRNRRVVLRWHVRDHQK